MPDAQLTVAQGTFTFASGQSAEGELFDAPSPPSAIFTADDDMAAGVLAATLDDKRLEGRTVPIAYALKIGQSVASVCG